jgi:hypothetical protein
MICNMCRTGADMISRGEEIIEEYKGQPTEVSETLMRYGPKLHLKCKGCDCQHGGTIPGLSQERGRGSTSKEGREIMPILQHGIASNGGV